MQLVLRGSAMNIRTTFQDADGAATAPTNPTVTIVRDSDGETIEDDSAATVEGNGARFTLNASDIPEVDLLRVSWSATGGTAPDQLVGVVGGFHCALEEISDDGESTDLRALREQAEDWIERSCGIAFRPAYYREQLEVDSASVLLSRPLATEVLSATIDGDEVDVTLGAGLATLDRCGTLDIAYVHGYESTPEAVRRATAKLAQHISAGGDNRISRFREDDQEVWLAMPGVTGETGIPEVDAVIERYGIPSVG